MKTYIFNVVLSYGRACLAVKAMSQSAAMQMICAWSTYSPEWDGEQAICEDNLFLVAISEDFQFVACNNLWNLDEGEVVELSFYQE